MRFWFNTREEAVIFIKKVCDRFDVCGRVSIADVNQLLRILSEESDYPKSKEYDYSRGWSDVSNFKIDTSYCANGCLVAAPDPIKFDSSKEDSGSKKTDTWAKDTVEVIKGNNLISDNVNHPNHYKTKNGLETIQVIEAFTDGLMGIEATDTGNVIKYICRWKKKNGLEDLKKAQWYLNHLINHVEKEN